MSTRFTWRLSVILPLFATIALVTAAVPASAQGLLGAVFEALGGRAPARIPPRASSYADPGSSGPLGLFGAPAETTTQGGGGGRTAYCVRTCDGRYFPIQGSSASPAELCKSMCAATTTMTFYGSAINHAVANDGTRYGDLDNAFVYRKQVVSGCTCNGKDAFGLAHIDLANDPTLREGDIVATSGGLMAYQTSRSRRGVETSNFTPIDGARFSRDLREKLNSMKVADTAPASSKTEAAALPTLSRTR